MNHEKDKPEKGGIHFGSPAVSEEKAIKCLEGLFNENKKEKNPNDPYVFEYVELSSVINKSQPGIIFNWGCKGFGFGQITLYTKNGKVYIDDEGMDKKFIKQMFNHFLDEHYIKRSDRPPF